MEALTAAVVGVLGLNAMVAIALTAMGEVIAEKSGVVNIGLEGMMLASAWLAVYADIATGSWAVGYLAGILMGLALGVVHAAIAVYARGDQIIAGVGLNLAAAGGTTLGIRAAWGNYGQSPPVASRPPAFDLLGVRVSFMVPLTFAIAVIAWILLERSQWGLRVKAVGDDPRSADALGVKVERTRLAATVLGASMAGLAGAYISIDYLGSFVKLVSAGRGFIALAAVAFSGWDVLGALLGSIIFGLGDAIATYYTTIKGMSAAAYPYKTIPYILTLLAVSATAWRARMPRALGRPYKRE